VRRPLEPFRPAERVRRLTRTAPGHTASWTLMEVCGGQTTRSCAMVSTVLLPDESAADHGPAARSAFTGGGD